MVSYLGIAISLWPMIVPRHFTLWQAASSASTQGFLLVGVLVLLPVILIYTGWSYWVFRGKVRAGHRIPLKDRGGRVSLFYFFRAKAKFSKAKEAKGRVKQSKTGGGQGYQRKSREWCSFPWRGKAVVGRAGRRAIAQPSRRPSLASASSPVV